MKFEVRITSQAISDLEDIHVYLSEDSTEAADRLGALLTQGIASLEEFPRRYVQAPESQRASTELRHMIVGNPFELN